MKKNGFTLIEVLVALAIFSLIGLAGYEVLRGTIRSDEQSTLAFERLQKLQRVMLIMEQDFRQATLRSVRVNGEQGHVGMRGGEGEIDSLFDGVTFVRSGRINPQYMLPRSSLQPVAYRVVEDKLERLSSHYVDNVIGYEPKVKVMLDKIEDFQVSYIDSQGKQQEAWQQEDLPRAVQVELTSAEYGKIVRIFLMAPLES